MVNSGVYKVSGANKDEDEEENRVILMVHDLKPPFLDGRTQYSTQMGAI